MRNNTSKTVRVAFFIQLFALLVLVVFRSDSFLSYTYDLDPNPVSTRLVLVAEFWDGQMEHLGVASVRNDVIGFVENLHGEEEF